VSLTKIPSRTDYVDLVYTNLRDAISDGTLRPGERITQEDFGRPFGCVPLAGSASATLIKKEGLLEEAPGRGLIVTRLDPERIGHLYQIRGALDGLAAKLAAERKQKISLALIEHGRQVARGSDVHAMIDADMAFHQAIYEASGNPLVAENAFLHWVALSLVDGRCLAAQRR